MHKFAVGQSALRREDQRLITGRGRFIDDINLAGQAHAAFVRSPFAHARVNAIDTGPAMAIDGVIAVLTHADVERAGLGSLPTITDVAGVDENGIRHPPRHALSGDVVRYVGDPVAMVIAETASQALAGAEAVEVDYDDLPAVADTAGALAEGAALVWPQFATNRCYHFHMGEEERVEAALAQAHHVARLTLVNNRVAPASIETRGAIGVYEAEAGRYVLHVSGQAVHAQRRQLAEAIFKVPAEKVRVVIHDVGGSFGAKNFVYPENVMVMLAAKLVGRAVKWVASRAENFLCETHGRDHVTTVELAIDEDHRFTALKVASIANMGAYLSSFATIIPTSASWVAMGGCYDIPAVSMSVDAVFTNTTPVDAYRGAGRPEATYLMERIVDVAARELGIGADDLRQRNLITAFPYKSALGMVIDCGDFAANLAAAKKAIDWDGFGERRQRAKRRGVRLGRGVSSYLEVTLGMPDDAATIRFDEDDKVTLLVGSNATGQGHETTYLQLLGDELGLSGEDVRFVQGDTGKVASGGGSGGSRTMAVVGSAVFEAACEVRRKGLHAASHVLEASIADLVFEDGAFQVRGTDRRIGLFELEARLRAGDGAGGDVAETLTSTGRYQRGAYNYPNGVHVCEVEVDEATGQVRIAAYVAVDDFGVVLNPALARGQVTGGAGQGIGQALLEGIVYDDDGQLLTGSLMDYALPRALDLPDFHVAFNETAPTATNPLGVKGCGEAGATAAPAAVVNAVCDALEVAQGEGLEMPLWPERVWRAMRAADKAKI